MQMVFSPTATIHLVVALWIYLWKKILKFDKKKLIKYKIRIPKKKIESVQVVRFDVWFDLIDWNEILNDTDDDELIDNN